MKTRVVPALGFLAIMGWSSCSFEPPDPFSTLPPATNTGQNTMGCLVDGQVWVAATLPSYGTWFTDPIAAVNPILILASKPQLLVIQEEDRDRNGLGFILNTFVGAGRYKLGTPRRISDSVGGVWLTTWPVVDAGAGFYDGDTQALYHRTGTHQSYTLANDTDRNYVLVSTYDTLKKIVAGTFAYDVVDSATSRVTHITEGRFDVNYLVR